MTPQNVQPQNKSANGTAGKLLRFLRGMPFSFILLFIIIAACVAGSIIPQGASAGAYAQQYGDRWAGFILWMQLDRVFVCWWFIALAGLLCLNLILCSVSRFPAVYRAWQAEGKREFGLWGSWLTHLGLLLMIIGFAAGQMLSTEAVAYGIPGSTQPLPGTDLTLTIDGFDVLLREDNTVEQYMAHLTVTNAAGESRSGAASVNHPFDAFGYSFYQDSVGWACYVDIGKDGQTEKTDLICVGEYTFPNDLPSLALLFHKFYPDLARGADGSLYSVTPRLNNPHFLYSLYYDGNMIAMDLAEPGVPVAVHNYAFTLYDPVEYTLIVAKSDPTAWLVGVSSAVLLAGLFLSFYVRPWEQNRRKEYADKSLSDQP